MTKMIRKRAAKTDEDIGAAKAVRPLLKKKPKSATITKEGGIYSRSLGAKPQGRINTKKIRESSEVATSRIIAHIQRMLSRKSKALPLSELTIGEWLEKWATETPDKEALVYSNLDLRYSYSELNERVNKLAKGFIEIGIGKGTHVGILATNVPDWVPILYACARIGAIAITVNTNYQQSELEFLCSQSDLEVLCMIGSDRDTNFIEMVYRMLPELKSCEKGSIESKRFPCMKSVIFIGAENHRGMYSIREILHKGEKADDAALNKLKSEVDCHDVVNIQYTSGTTGFPRGAMLTHYGITNNAFLIGEHMRYTARERLCCCVPLFHCFGLVLATLNILTHGGTLVVVEKFDPLMVLATIQKERCTSLFGVPTMFIAELNHPMFNMFNLKSLRVGIIAGAVVPEEVARRVEEKMHMKVTSVYGLTEASPGMTASRCWQSFPERCATVGYEFEHTDVKIINPDTGEPCKVGETGELCNKGYNTMVGYYKDPEGTAEVIDKNGYLHSGDLGYRDERGNYRITGRIKDMIIRGGENIYPKEIEMFLYKMPGVKDVQVAGIPSKKYGEQVGAFIIKSDDSKITEGEVREFCRGKIARFKIPKYVLFLKEFPLTGSGKVQKFKLKEIALAMLGKMGVEIV